MAGRVVRAAFESRVLRGNPLGDPDVRTVPLWLPPSYDATPARRYPVVFLLTGFTGRGTMLLNDGAWTEAIDVRMERLVREGCPEAIVVMPDCFTRWGGSQYLNSAATGRYEDHVADELVPWVDAELRTIPGARAVMGKSSGGFGALSLLMSRPGLFRAGASHSGDAFFEYCYLRDFPDACDVLARRGGLSKFLADFPALPNKGLKDVQKALNIVAMASCYSPDASAADGFVLPFDERTGEVRQDEWRRWLALDPVRRVEDAACASALRDLDLLFIDCGTKDEFALHLGARILATKLAAHGVPHEHEEFDDGHFNITYRYDVSIPKLIRALV